MLNEFGTTVEQDRAHRIVKTNQAVSDPEPFLQLSDFVPWARRSVSRCTRLLHSFFRWGHSRSFGCQALRRPSDKDHLVSKAF